MIKKLCLRSILWIRKYDLFLCVYPFVIFIWNIFISFTSNFIIVLFISIICIPIIVIYICIIFIYFIFIPIMVIFMSTIFIFINCISFICSFISIIVIFILLFLFLFLLFPKHQLLLCQIIKLSFSFMVLVPGVKKLKKNQGLDFF